MESMMFVNGEYITPHNKQFIGKTSPIDGKKSLELFRPLHFANNP